MRTGEEAYRPFDLGKVEAYIHSIRSASRNRLSRLEGFEDLASSPVSLPIASWLYYQARSASPDKAQFARVIKNDSARNAYRSGKDITLVELSEPIPQSDLLYERSVKLVESVWPEMASLIRTIDPRMSHPPESETYESASDPLRFGQVYYNMKKSTAIDWARILVHEIAHHYLFVITAEWEASGVRYPWDIPVYSSIKNTERPLIGLLHGAFAQACMLELAVRLNARHRVLDEETVRGVEWIFNRYGAGYLSDCITLSEHKLLDACPELTTAFSRRNIVAESMARKAIA
jgi:hypothetical protein